MKISLSSAPIIAYLFTLGELSTKSHSFTPLSLIVSRRLNNNAAACLTSYDRRQRQFHPLHYQNDNSTDANTTPYVKPTTTTAAASGVINHAGVIEFATDDEFLTYQKNHPSTLLLLKFYAPYCRACKRLAPLYKKLSMDAIKKYPSRKIQFAEINSRANMPFAKSQGIVALPTVSFFSGSDGLIYTMQCGPSKIPLLKKKLEEVILERFDEATGDLTVENDDASSSSTSSSSSPDRPIDYPAVTSSSSQIDTSYWTHLRHTVPYFSTLSDSEFSDITSQATIHTYPPGSIILRQGTPGRALYVIQSGTVDVLTRRAIPTSFFSDPLLGGGGGGVSSSSSPNDEGTTVNTLTKDDYFGERALMTGDPLAATMRAVDETTCVVFREENVPERSFSSMGRRTKRARVEEANEKYGVYYDDDVISIQDEAADAGFDYWKSVLEVQVRGANVANQERGSANHPRPMRGVDTDEVLEGEEEILRAIEDAGWSSWNTEEVSVFPPPEGF